MERPDYMSGQFGQTSRRVKGQFVCYQNYCHAVELDISFALAWWQHFLSMISLSVFCLHENFIRSVAAGAGFVVPHTTACFVIPALIYRCFNVFRLFCLFLSPRDKRVRAGNAKLRAINDTDYLKSVQCRQHRLYLAKSLFLLQK